MCTVNNRTFIHGDCQWLPSILSVLAESKGGRPLCCADALNGQITHRPKIRREAFGANPAAIISHDLPNPIVR